MKNQGKVIKTLKEQAASNPVLNAVLHMWALRKRARNDVTATALAARMAREGFNYTQDEYASVLRILANLGLGQLETSGGKPFALRNVRVTLQSIGLAALGQKFIIEDWKPRNKYEKVGPSIVKLTPPQQEETPPAVQPAEAPTQPEITPVLPVALVVRLNNKSVTIPVPQDLSSEEIGVLIERFRGKAAAL